MSPLTTRVFVVFNAYSPTQRAPTPTLISSLLVSAKCFDAGAIICNLDPGVTSQAVVRYTSRRGTTSHFFGTGEFMSEFIHKEDTICQVLAFRPDILLLRVHHKSDWRLYLSIARTLNRKIILVLDESEVDDIDAYVADVKLFVEQSPGRVMSATIYPDDVYGRQKSVGQMATMAVDITDVAIMTYSSFDMEGLPLVHGFLESYSYYKDTPTRVPRILQRMKNAACRTVKYNTLFQVMLVNEDNPFNAVVVGLQGTIKSGHKYTLHRSPVYPDSPTEIVVTALYTMECREVPRVFANEIALLHYRFVKSRSIISAVPIDIGMRITEIRFRNRYCHRKVRDGRTLCLHVRKTNTQFEVIATRYLEHAVSLTCGLSNVHGVVNGVKYVPGGWNFQIAINEPMGEEWFVAWKGDECCIFVLDGDDDMVCGFVKDVY
ncbi:hypothetical protein V1520DRAFT_342386 [Lipomyces starkeyi]|uniref:Uncharacterized protein n=1 Tax=Lipomyces starkeyi NRRL Y-11557 TaxID=675824 RepID=A0A1E3Q0X9_LIPST|nr:hypothetical protein LIPSTDRAFT_65071 [Lipomyces starkeyi NRRL Y-11557]